MSLLRLARIQWTAENLVGATKEQVEAAEAEAVRADPVAAQAVVDEAVRFLRCGALSYAEWCALAEWERDAFVEGSRTVLAERAAAIGFAATSEDAARHVAAASDGGQSLVSSVLSKAVAAVAKSAPTESPAPAEPRP